MSLGAHSQPLPLGGPALARVLCPLCGRGRQI